MNDIILDTTTHDLVITNNDISLFEDLEHLTAQKVKINLLNYRGEWFRDINIGVSYLQSILGIRNSKATADTVLKTVILDTDNISNITSYSSVVNSDRKLIVTFSATMNSGGTIEDISVEV